MQNFVTFWANILPVICDFLLSEPIIYFVGFFILILIAGFIRSILFISK